MSRASCLPSCGGLLGGGMRVLVRTPAVPCLPALRSVVCSQGSFLTSYSSASTFSSKG